MPNRKNAWLENIYLDINDMQFGCVKRRVHMKLNKYICDVCGWIYNPEIGDPDSGIDPGTPFEEIPDDWVCPVCGVSKDQFSLYEE